MKLGKKPHVEDKRDLKLADFQQPLIVPDEFGHEAGLNWQGMLGNDEAGNCVWAGAAHETILLASEGGRHPVFSTKSVLSDYSAVTGYVPGDESTDQGTEVREAMAYRAKTGIADSAGRRHHIGAYLKLEAQNLEELYRAAYTFGVVGIGIEFPASAMDQFNEGKPWDVVSGSRIEGGHYVPVVARRNGGPVCVTWGRTQPMTEKFFSTFCDECWCFLSGSVLNGEGKSPEGLDVSELRAALSDLR